MSDKLDGFIYDGTFELAFLKSGESVRAGRLGCSCEIVIGDFEKVLPVSVGDCVARDEKGQVIVVATARPKP
jgi:hypothetical protein